MHAHDDYSIYEDIYVCTVDACPNKLGWERQEVLISMDSSRLYYHINSMLCSMLHIVTDGYILCIDIYLRILRA